MDKSLLALKVIGGLLSGGLQGYSTAKKLRQDAAIAQLREIPDVAKTYAWIKGVHPVTGKAEATLTPDEQKERFQTTMALKPVGLFGSPEGQAYSALVEQKLAQGKAPALAKKEALTEVKTAGKTGRGGGSSKSTFQGL